ncbi:MAG: hypothetical protein M3461_14590 [Pseudomonadota bacterium]|nr:hypothetical protein [Pseudomonadota bacterium]
MNKLRHSFLGIVLVAAFAAAPATMAEDFRALSQLSTGFTAMPEDQLASIEGTGGACVENSCNATAINSTSVTAAATGGSVTITAPTVVCTIDILGLICVTL